MVVCVLKGRTNYTITTRKEKLIKAHVCEKKCQELRVVVFIGWWTMIQARPAGVIVYPGL